MIKHVVFFQMKQDVTKEVQMDYAKNLADKFQSISKKIPEAISCETGFNYNKEKVFYELCLIQEFENQEALDRYLIHPLHLEVRTYVFEVIDHREVIDFEIV